MLSLKAELLRKHEEVNKAKSSHVINNFIPTKKSTKTGSKDDKNRREKADQELKKKNVELEDSELLNKSKRVLEAKSKYYDKMCSSGGGLNSEENCLVMFNHKKQSQPMNRLVPSSSDESSDDEPISHEPDCSGDDWVEYTDCLGRTRKCLKEDVDFFKKKDLDLADTVSKRTESNFVSLISNLILVVLMSLYIG